MTTNNETLANAIAAELLHRNPDYYPGRRQWAKEKLIDICLDWLEDEDMELEEDDKGIYDSLQEKRESIAREAASEWWHESWANRE